MKMHDVRFILVGALSCTVILGALTACGAPTDRHSDHKVTFVTKPGGVRVEKASDSSPADTSTTKAVQPTIPKETVLLKPSELVTTGRLKTELPEYQIPERLRARIAKYQPELLTPKNLEFDVKDPNLTIDAKEKKVTFTGTLTVKGKPAEAFELQCGINTEDVPWVCTDMAPTNKKIAAEKRIQGVFKCLDAYVCDSVGVAIWISVDGKLQEPKLFQAEGFRVRRASSGDEDEDDPIADPTILETKNQDRITAEPNSKSQKAKLSPQPAPGNPFVPVPIPKPRPPEQKPPVVPAPAKVQLRDEEINVDLNDLEDPEVPLEISEPMTMPAPKVGKYSIPGVEKLPTDVGNGKVQAVGWHNRGRLEKPAEFAASGPGFVSRDHGKKDFGTDVVVQLITGALARMNSKFPGRAPILIGQIANPTGGRLYNMSGHSHASHQTGLDADVGLPFSTPQNSLVSACGKNGCSRSQSVSEDFDVERFWFFAKQITCAENNPVIAMFIDRQIKQAVCQHVKKSHEDMGDPCVAKTLQSLVDAYQSNKLVTGHDNHVHVRLRCPEKSSCQNTWVTLANRTGC